MARSRARMSKLVCSALSLRSSMIAVFLAVGVLPHDSCATNYRERIGFDIDALNQSDDPVGNVQMASQIGGWARVGCNWHAVQENANSPYVWNRDQLVEAAIDNNMNVVINLCYAPRWAISPDVFFSYEDSNGVMHSQWPAPDIGFIEDWIDFCEAAALHYYEDFGVVCFEIGNEPNSFIYYTEYPTSIPYPTLLRSAYEAITNVIPSSAVPQIITGGLWPTAITYDVDCDNTYDYQITGVRDWLTDFYAYDFSTDTHYGGQPVQPVSDFFTALGYHPYAPLHSNANDQCNTTILSALETMPGVWAVPTGYIYPDEALFLFTESIHRIMASQGDGDKKIWATECGRRSRQNCTPIENEELLQANWVSEYVSTWMTDWNFTGPFIWYNFQDHHFEDPNGQIPTVYMRYGVVREDDSTKPAYYELLQWGAGIAEFHIGDGPEFRYHEWNAELADQITDAQNLASTVKVYFHDRQDPYIVDFSLFDLAASPPADPNSFSELKLFGVGPGYYNTDVPFQFNVSVQPTNFGCLDIGAFSLSIDNLAFNGSGEIYSLNLFRASTGEIQIRNCSFQDLDHYSPGSLALIEALQGSVSLDNVVIKNNSLTMGIAYASIVTIENCLISNNHWSIEPGRQLYNCAFTASHSLNAVGTTFDSNWSVGIFAEDDYDLCAASDAHVELKNCLLTGSPEGDSSGGCPKLRNFNGGSSFSDLTITYCATDQDDWAGDVPAFSHATNRIFPPDSLDTVVRYVNAESGDFRLKGDSQLLDKGDPEKKDFDLTESDIGWAPQYRVVVLSEPIDDDLPVGYYRVTGSMSINGSIEPGSVIRVDSGSLTISEGQSAPYSRMIGDTTQPRTTIVGRSSPESEVGTSIRFRNVGNHDTATLRFSNVLFNYPTVSSYPKISFSNWDNSSQDGVLLDGEAVEFRYWSDVTGSIPGNRYDGLLSFVNCSARIQGLEFGTYVQNADDLYFPASVQQVNGRLIIEDCSFVPGAGWNSINTACVTMIGTVAGDAVTVLTNNVFIDEPNSAALLDLTNTIVAARGNQFLGCLDESVYMSHSVLHADQQARNEWLAEVGSFAANKPMFNMSGGNLDLDCGQNSIVVDDYSALQPIVMFGESDPDTPVAASWRGNYWGNGSCNSAIPESVLNSLDLALLPPWTIAEDNLDHCFDLSDPEYPGCLFDESDSKRLLIDGKLAEGAGLWAEAQANYRWLLRLYPAAKECTEGTLRLKALGLHKTYGPEAYESVRDDLFAAADSSGRTKHQGVLQLCGGWCVEARWGDREAAIHALTTMQKDETDPLNKDTIALALLEIALYPSQGGLSAVGPGAAAARAQAEERAVDELVQYKRGQWAELTEEITLPLSFEISNLYPNPFNARTTIEYSMPSDGRLILRVYNLLGQLVGTPFDGEATAGRHRVIVDGSGWASGLYFVAAEHEDSVRMRKMMLIK